MWSVTPYLVIDTEYRTKWSPLASNIFVKIKFVLKMQWYVPCIVLIVTTSQRVIEKPSDHTIDDTNIEDNDDWNDVSKMWRFNVIWHMYNFFFSFFVYLWKLSMSEKSFMILLLSFLNVLFWNKVALR